ncbi:organic solvent tolerance protein OstA [Methylosinus sp. H3A]|uniref:LptA/OstA family protein n=1 Tax=Methylosinus sp. H3A TaxID=2785786 RepID=UPI0018C1EAA9|nr:LptA/OstA family protein [Methylosinus sp. H3A]MBG0809219.1 organic solvent tolerance protein OstA [Methylosinus sp. H3A]
MKSFHILKIFHFLPLAMAALLAAAPLAAKGRSGGILPGSSAKDPVDIDAGKLDYFDKEQKLVYSGGVVVVNGPSTLKASRLILFLDKAQQGQESGGSDRVRHIDAEGPVTLVSKDQIGSGDKGSYDRGENKVYLIGNVTLSQGDNVAKGEKLVYDVGTGQATILGQRVRSIFTPGEAKGEKKEKKEPAPVAEERRRAD